MYRQKRPGRVGSMYDFTSSDFGAQNMYCVFGRPKMGGSEEVEVSQVKRAHPP